MVRKSSLLTITSYEVAFGNKDWFGLVLGHINPYKLFNANSSFYIYIKHIWFVNYIFEHNIFKWVWTLFFSLLNGFKYCYVTQTILCTHLNMIC